MLPITLVFAMFCYVPLAFFLSSMERQTGDDHSTPFLILLMTFLILPPFPLRHGRQWHGRNWAGQGHVADRQQHWHRHFFSQLFMADMPGGDIVCVQAVFCHACLGAGGQNILYSALVAFFSLPNKLSTYSKCFRPLCLLFSVFVCVSVSACMCHIPRHCSSWFI